MRDQVSHPYKTRAKIVILHILVSTILYMRQEVRTLTAEWQQAFHEFSLISVSSLRTGENYIIRTLSSSILFKLLHEDRGKQENVQ
jgi:hypothetical protein